MMIKNWIVGKEPTEKKLFFWNMMGSAVYALTSLVLTYLTIRLIGDVEGGIFAIALTLAQMFIYIAYYEMRNYQVTDARDCFTFSEYHAVKIINCILMMVVVSVYIFIRQYDAGKAWIVFLVCLYRMLDGYADVYEAEFHKRGRLDLAGKSMTFRSVISVGVYFLILIFSHNLLWAVMGAILSGIVGIFVFNVYVFDAVGGISAIFRFDTIRQILRECFPLFLGMFLWTYLLSASRIAVDGVMASEYQSYYQVLFMPVSVINLFAGFLIRPSLLELTEQYSAGKMGEFWGKIRKMLILLIGFTAVCMVGAYLCGIPVIEILVNCELDEYRMMFVFLILAGGVNAVVYLLYYVLTIFRARMGIMVGYGIASVIAFVISKIMTRHMGLWGASWSYFISITSLLIVFVAWILAVNRGDRRARTQTEREESFGKDGEQSHVVIDSSWMQEEELENFFACVEKAFDNKEGRIIHLLEENVNADILRTAMFPYYFFEENLHFWKVLFGLKEAGNGVYQAFLSDFMWKIKNNVMWPYHYGKEELQNARTQVTELLNQVPDELILRQNKIDNFHRYYLFGLKTEGEIKAEIAPDALRIVRNNQVVYESKKIEIVLVKFRPVKNKIRFIAFIKSPVFNFCEKPKLWMETNDSPDEKKEIPLKLSSWSYYKTKEQTNSFYTFILNIDTENVESFHFYVEIQSTMFDTYFYFMPEVVFNTKYNRYRYYVGTREYRFDHNTFRIGEVLEEEVDKRREEVGRQFADGEPEVKAFREKILEGRREKRRIWLYYDCKGVYKDNGYYQFEHDFPKEDGRERYYVLNNDIEGCRELFSEEQISHVIQFGSDEHKLLYCLSTCVIAPYIEKNNYLPFSADEYAKLIDVATMPSLVYLQHAVYHANIPWKYSLDRMQVDKVVVTTKKEQEIYLGTHCFTKKYILPYCMPRFDFLDAQVKPQKKILYAPSWRKYLVDMVDKEWISCEDRFLQSRFYRETQEFLTDKSLLRFMKRKGYTLDFKLHPILARYAKLYHVDGEIIRIAPESVKDEEYAIFITDFSSYVFDFVYLKRAILYFFPDYEEYKSGMSDYRETSPSQEDGFGEFTVYAKDAVRVLKKLIRQKGKNQEEYLKKARDIFFYRDNGARDRIYDNLSGKSKIKTPK